METSHKGMVCIDNYLKKFDNQEVKEIVYQLVKDKNKAKNLRDRVIIETFDTMYPNHECNKDIFEKISKEFNASVSHVKYTIYNRCLAE